MTVSVFSFTPDDFKYPTKAEFLDAESRFPDISNFGFCHKGLPELISEEGKSLKEAGKRNNLFWWDNCLLNKIGSLRFAFVNTYVDFQRNSENINGQNDPNGSIHEFLIGFYAETTYYFIISIRDIISQILNVYLDLGFVNEKFSYKVFEEKVKSAECISKSISKTITEFSLELYNASEIRNSLTHRYPKTQKDFRIKYEPKHTSLKRGGSVPYYSQQEIMDNIQFSLEALKRFIDQLKKEINPNANKL